MTYVILMIGLFLALPLLGWRRKWKEAEAKYQRMREYYRGRLFRKRRSSVDKAHRVRDRGGRLMRPRYPVRR